MSSTPASTIADETDSLEGSRSLPRHDIAFIHFARPQHERRQRFLLPKRSTLGRLRNREQPWCLSRRKRLFDVVGASVLIALSAPILLVAAGAIKITSPGPVMFRQWRTGYAGRRFRIYKLRTMRRDAERLKAAVMALNHHASGSPDFKARNDPRVTLIGRVLRKLSLDELPNLFNVIEGDMSLVGPRPTSFAIDAYNTEHLARLSVPPGLTGLWQISGRSDLDFDKRLELDQRYIQEQSFAQDAKILMLTPFRVLGGRGAY